MPATTDLSSPVLDPSNMDFLSILSAFDEGVIITDKAGRILFYNETQAKIDDLTEDIIGQNVVDVYNLDESNSKILQCIKTGLPIKGELFFYRTRRGKVANTIHSVFPLLRDQTVIGAVCFVKDYTLLEKTITATSWQEPDNHIGNGTRYRFTDIMGLDNEFLQAVRMARLAANSPSPIMLCGETGTGKEMFAQSIHNYSARGAQQFVGINCAAIPEHLLEGLLFGTTKGSFTNAVDKAGIFEHAHGGTLFLDEVNSMPINLQAKLLRVLQERKIRRLGGHTDINIDLKIISSVNNYDPHQAIKQDTLRMDLFYRLCVVSIQIPPLRELKNGLELLTRHFINKNNLTLDKNIKEVSNVVMPIFRSYHWPGNTRELAHIIEGSMNVIEHGERVIEVSHLPLHFMKNNFQQSADNGNIFKTVSKSKKKEDMSDQTLGHLSTLSIKAHMQSVEENLPQRQQFREKEMVLNALIKKHGNVSAAARTLGISRQVLHYKMKKYILSRDDYTD